jgi:hypothetical protein
MSVAEPQFSAPVCPLGFRFVRLSRIPRRALYMPSTGPFSGIRVGQVISYRHVIFKTAPSVSKSDI